MDQIHYQAVRRLDESRPSSGWAVVTGASSGIGRAFVQELVARGYGVVAVARRHERLEALARETAERRGHVEPLVADLQTGEGLESVTRRISELGPIELLVNNAGAATAGDFLSASLDQELGAIRLNVDAVVRLTHAVLPEMAKRGRGAIINLASVVAFQMNRFMPRRAVRWLMGIIAKPPAARGRRFTQ